MRNWNSFDRNTRRIPKVIGMIFEKGLNIYIADVFR